MRYGGSNDRRTVKRAEVPDWVVRGAFRLDDSLLSVLRAERLVRVDFDRRRRGGDRGRAASRGEPGDWKQRAPTAGPGPQRDRDSTRSG